MSNIHKSAIVEGNVKISEDVIIGPGAVVRGDITIGDGTVIEPNAVIEGNVDIGKNNRIGIGTCIGTSPQAFKYEEDTKVIIGDGNVIREYVTINRSTKKSCATLIGNKIMLMAYVHVAHDCRIADEAILANCVTLGGHIEVQEKAVIGGVTPVHQFVRIGKMAIVGGGSRIPKDVVPYCLVAGSPAHVYGLNKVGLKRRNYPAQLKKKLKEAYSIIFRSGLNTSHAVEEMEKRKDLDIVEVREMTDFIKTSKRGITK